MSSSDQYWLKWIPASEAIRHNISHFGIRECLIYAEEKGELTGFTLFREEHLDSSLMARIQKRFEGQTCRLHVILPATARKTWDHFAGSGFRLDVQIHVSDYFHLVPKDRSLEVRDHLTLINVDDSPVILKMLKQVFSQTSGIRLVAQVSDPRLAADEIRRLRPDAVTMDIQMPGKTGVQLVQDLQRIYPVPIVMVSSLGLEEGSMVYQALEQGAFDYVQKPELSQVGGFHQELLQKIEMAIQGFSIQSRLRQKRPENRRALIGQELMRSDLIWCIGASTGGTQALTRVLTRLPAQIPPTLIVQHIPPVFSKSFADSLHACCPFQVVEASHGQELKPNTVYIAPGGFQMALSGRSDQLRLEVTDAPPVNRFKPSVDYLLSSVARVKGISVIAGILTGMGKDGAEGLLQLRRAGAVTFAQDESSSVVYGMPRAAKENGAAQEVLALDQVADFLVEASARHARSA